MKLLQKGVLILIALVAAGCAEPGNDGAESAAASAGLDLSQPPNKVTDENYRHEPVPVAQRSVNSVDADGNVAPFGMASRAKREVAPPPAGQQPKLGDEVGNEAVASGQPAAFVANCVACHGADAKGVEGLGLDLTASRLVAESGEDELVAFLRQGRQPDSPDSVTGVPMPAFNWLPDEDLTAIAAYLKSL